MWRSFHGLVILPKSQEPLPWGTKLPLQITSPWVPGLKCTSSLLTSTNNNLLVSSPCTIKST